MQAMRGEGDASSNPKPTHANEVVTNNNVSSARSPNTRMPLPAGWRFEYEGEMVSFKVESLIGAGSFGKVYKARVLETGEIVAIKQIEPNPYSSKEEGKMMMCVQSRNVCKMIMWFIAYREQGGFDTFIVMEYVSSDLYTVFRRCRKKGWRLSNNYIMLLMYQLLKGISVIHSKGIGHRDLKPGNVLLNPTTNEVKICDFGSAKDLTQMHCYVTYVCSRFYRAPELVLVCPYDHAVDMWSAGCIFAEFFIHDALFKGESAEDQIAKIIDIMGTPTDDELKDLGAHESMFRLPKIPSKDLKQVLWNRAGPEALDLLSKMLDYSPRNRISAFEAMQHEYFDPIREPGFKISHGSIPVIFDSLQESQIIHRSARDPAAFSDMTASLNKN